MARPDGWVGSDLRARAEVVQWLHNHGDEIHDPTGLIVGRMRTELGKGRALSQLLQDMERDGMIQREVRGRRTMMLKLLDDWNLLDEIRTGQQVGTWGVTPNGESEALDVSGVDLEALAETLLAVCIKRAQAQPSTDRNARTEKLEAEVAKLKAQLTEARDNLILARESEAEQRRQADSMRESLAKLQRSMDRKPAKGTVPLREQLRPADRKLLEQLMRTAPAAKG